MVKYFAWDDIKNAKLRAERGIGFEDMVFLKTIVPSRKATKQYLGEEPDGHED